MKFTPSLVAVLLAFAIAAPAVCTPPNSELPGLEERGQFVPSAGYVRTTLLAHYARRAAERGRAAFAPGQPLSLTGIRSIPVICMKFADVEEPFPPAEYETMLFGDGAGAETMTTYFRDMSKGRFEVTGRVVGWYKAPRDHAYYRSGVDGFGRPFGELLTFALQQADADLDFGQFDNDGKDGRANSGDDDGKVDTVSFIHPLSGGECLSQPPHIWSHSWHYKDQSYGHPAPFVTDDIRLDATGQPKLDPQGQPERIVVDDYTIQPGQACGSTTAHPRIIQIGVFCHEFAHALGLPDLYDRTPKGDPDSAGAGHWCLMAGGGNGGDGNHPERPVRMSSWCKYYLGWSNPVIVHADEAMDLAPVALENDSLRIIVPDTDGLEYFLLEHRRNDFGGEGVNWDQYLPGSGLAVWHIDERVGDASDEWPFTGTDRGQNDSPVRINIEFPPMFKAKHPLVSLLQADRKRNLDRNDNPGDAGDLFIQGNLADDETGLAGTRGYNGEKTDIAINGIHVTLNGVTGNIVVPQSQTPASGPSINSAPPATPLAVEVAPAEAAVLQEVEGKIPSPLKAGGRLKAPQIAELRAQLNEDEEEAVEKASPDVLRRLFGPGAETVLKQLGAQLRLKQVGDAGDAEASSLAAVREMVGQSADLDNIRVGYASGGTQVCMISGLRVPSKSPTPREDAERLLETVNVFKRALTLAETEYSPLTADKTSGVQQFAQLAKVGDAKLPVFGAGLTMHYNTDDELISVSNSSIPDLESIGGAAAKTTAEQAAAAAAEALGVSKSLVRESSKGVVVRAADEGERSGRVAFRVLVTIAPGHEPLEAFVDSETLKVLEVR